MLILVVQSTLVTPTLVRTTKFAVMTIWMSRNLRLSGDSQWEIMKEYCIKISSYICFEYLLESPHWGDSSKAYVLWGNKNKTRLSDRPACPYRILYNSKFILMATSLGTNAVVVTKVHCIMIYSFMIFQQKIKALTALVGRLSLSLRWENGPERGLLPVIGPGTLNGT